MKATCTLLAAALVTLASSAALAGPTPKDRAEARHLVADAQRAMKERRPSDAVGALRKANKLDPSPAVALALADAEIAAGKLVDASRVLSALADGPAATPAAKKARDAARRKLADLRPRIPTVRVAVQGAAPGDAASVSIDGRDVEAGADVPVDPGQHDLGAAASGMRPAEREVTLAEGAHRVVSLTLEPAVVAPKAPPPPQHGSRAPGIVVASVGGAALAVGGVFGGLAFAATADARKTCNPLCNADKVDHAKLMGNVSTGLLVAGGAVAVSGIVLAIVAPGGSSAKADDAQRSARVVPWVGGSQVGVAGTF